MTEITTTPFTSEDFRAVLRGDTDSIRKTVPDGVDIRRVHAKASGLLRQVKDRDGRLRTFTWSLAREKAVRVYIDPDSPRTLVCDATAHDARKKRAYAPVLQLEVGQSCVIELRANTEPAHVHQHLSYLSRKIEAEYGYRPSFHCALTVRLGVYRITRLKDGANPRFDPLTYSGPTLKAIEANLE